MSIYIDIKYIYIEQYFPTATVLNYI